ncbi:hypothetical protein C484_19182 [Natrialba taiwanensis DSM 12281]|uniref:Uncharacterized protein n=1 Tax=Natrialba taiwanensis DSM 12281 TaxID=1230458 RepID=L9ZG91_9EURY|nr:hypothetical protein C484_19182 [Natrialba taiwanensis DSM 12281]
MVPGWQCETLIREFSLGSNSSRSTAIVGWGGDPARRDRAATDGAVFELISAASSSSSEYCYSNGENGQSEFDAETGHRPLRTVAEGGRSSSVDSRIEDRYLARSSGGETTPTVQVSSNSSVDYNEGN